MYNKTLKGDLDIGIEMPDSFYDEVIFFELNVIYYGEKTASLIYKKLKLDHLSKIEKKHEKIIKKIIKPEPLDKKIITFLKNILKLKNEELYRTFLNDLEHYAFFRFKTIINYINDENVIKKLNIILMDEMEHFEESKKLSYKTNFEGFENEKMYNKYKDILKIDYETFRKKMWQTVFYKKMRGQN